MGIMTSVLLKDCEKSGAGVCVARPSRLARMKIRVHEKIAATIRGTEREETAIGNLLGRARIACCAPVSDNPIHRNIGRSFCCPNTFRGAKLIPYVDSRLDQYGVKR